MGPNNHFEVPLKAINKKTGEENVSRIDKSRKVMTLVNIFTVKPDDQSRVVELLVEATEATMKTLPSFVSANQLSD